MILRRRRTGALAALLLVTALTGCGEKTVDYDVESQSRETTAAESQKETDETAPTADTGEFTDSPWALQRQFPQSKWQTELNLIDSTGKMCTAKVDAQVIVPEADGMIATELTNELFTPEYREQLMTNLADDGAVYYWDDLYKTKEQWQNRIRMYEGEIQNNVNEAKEPDIDPELEAGLQSSIQAYTTAIEEARRQMEQAPVEMTLAEDFSGQSYYAYVDERLYNVYFGTREYTGDTRNPGKQEWIYIDAENPEQFAPEALADAVGWNFRAIDSEQENGCSKTAEEAIALGEPYMEAMGIPEAVCTKVQALEWTGYCADENKTVINGYAVTYAPSSAGIPWNRFGTEYDYPDVYWDETDYQLDSSATVYVTDQGILRLEVRNPVNVTRRTEAVALLSFEKICEIIEQEIAGAQGIYGGYGDADCLNYMELIYFRVRNQEREGQYTYIPVWRLSGRPMYTEMRSALLVNAMDGSVIRPNG